AMASQKSSPVRMDNATLMYTGQLRGTENQLSLSYNVQLNPTFMSNIVLLGENLTADVIDMDWRSISMTEPLTLATPYGNIDINYPIGLLQANPLSYLIQQPGTPSPVKKITTKMTRGTA
ncbi:MAG: hypothetical protein ACRD47_15990, partial [Nitrososphaeraceae archaeon]